MPFLKIETDKIEKGIEKCSNIPGRMETFKMENGAKVIIDYAHTPDAYEKVLFNIKELNLNFKNLYVLFGTGGDRDKSKRKKMGSIVETFATHAFIVPDNPRTEDQVAIFKDIKSGFKKNNFTLFYDRDLGVKTVIGNSKESDVVVILGKGRENYQMIGNKKVYQSDLDIIKELPMRIDIVHQKFSQEFFYNSTKTRLKSNIKGISTDTREIFEGDLFVAIKGNDFDGNNFIGKASELGASAALVSTISNETKIQQIKVKNPVDTLIRIATLWRHQFKIPVIAITGSNGKTSTKELLHHLLSGSYKVHATNKNFNTSLGLSLTLLELNEFHEISILELGSSMPGEIKALCEISDPTHGLITNIAPAHYMNFGSIQNIVNEKIELFNYLKDGTCFLNVSDKELSKVHIKGKKITFGINVNCDFKGE